MLFRYRARNYPETLTQDEQGLWQKQRLERLVTEHGDGRLNLTSYFERLDELIVQEGWTEEQQALLENLVIYGEELADSLNI